jgi:DNA-binding Xre family transcriptional regulator
MIKTHVQEIAKQRGITTAYQLQKALNISPSVAAKIYSDDFEMISRKSLDRLCKVLDTTPAELISYAVDSKKQRRGK